MEPFEIGQRKSIKDLILEGNPPNPGDFLVRRNRIVEIFKGLSDEGWIMCFAWWNFSADWGDFYNPNETYCMGDGGDTYIATNQEIELLINKLKEAGQTWDFKTRTFI